MEETNTQKFYERLEKGGSFIPQHFKSNLDTVGQATWDNIWGSLKYILIKEETFDDSDKFLQNASSLKEWLSSNKKEDF